MASRKPENQPTETPGDGPWNEIVGLLLFGIGFVITLALVSYSSEDPSFNTTGLHEKAGNWIGPMGASLADFLFQAFGMAALTVPLTLFLAGWWSWQDDRSTLPKFKMLGFFLVIVASTGVLTMLGPEDPQSFYLGGLVGRWLVYGPAGGLMGVLGTIGAIVALLILLVIGLLIGTDFSIIGTIVRLTPDEEGAGMFTTIGRGFRAFGRTEVTETQSDPVSENLREKNRTPAVPKPIVNMRGGARPKTAAGDNHENLLDSAADHAAEVVRPAIMLPSSTPQLTTSPLGSGKRAGSKNRADLDIAPDESDFPGDETVQGEISPQRTVDEMMATASVKRTDNTEEREKAAPARKPSKFATAIARIAANYKLPSTEMLTPPSPRSEMEETELLERARHLAEKCAEFNVSGQVKQISPGPVVTTFEFKPDPGVKYSRVTSLVDDLCLALKAESVRIDRIPGKSTVGIEVPNSNREVIRLREVVESKKYSDSASKLTIAMGKTIDGSNYIADLTKMPHLLIAGATGAGKSVMLNGILVSLLYKASPDEVKMILVDPKRLELGLYADIPHLLTPIVTDPKRASYALKWAVSEMENRYKHLAAFGVRNIDQYNTEVCASFKGRVDDDNPDQPKPLPYIVVVIDELADLMMVSARDVEESITRLAQMARAVGIHLVLATQRPSVDVITGLIKANFPSRISFRVSSKVDSRTIIDSNGAEQLLGQGDMLFLPPGTSRLLRVHGAFVDEKEIKRICDFVRSQANPAYDEKVVMSEKEVEGGESGDMPRDEKYDDALRIVIQNGKASTSLLQRTLRIGYGRAASIIDMMHREGIVGPEDGSKPRQVLVKPDFLERLEQLREENDL